MKKINKYNNKKMIQKKNKIKYKFHNKINKYKKKILINNIIKI